MRGAAGKAFERVRSFALIMLALAVLAPTPASAREGAPKRSAVLMQAEMLAQHNAERSLHGLPPLDWSADLALAAEESARRLSKERDPIAAHGRGIETHGQGENFWVGTRGAYTYQEMVQAWLVERTHYLNGAVPEISRTGEWIDVGHYSQIIWTETQRVGCALVSNAVDDLLVCRYDPAGNVLGRKALVDLAAR